MVASSLYKLRKRRPYVKAVCDTKRTANRKKLSKGSQLARNAILPEYDTAAEKSKPTIPKSFSIKSGQCCYIDDLNEKQLEDVSNITTMNILYVYILLYM